MNKAEAVWIVIRMADFGTHLAFRTIFTVGRLLTSTQQLQADFDISIKVYEFSD